MLCIRHFLDETKRYEDIAYFEINERDHTGNMLDWLGNECYKVHLFNCITSLKKQLLEIAEEKGMNHRDTLYVSQELDKFITQYQKLK
ncbi:Spo0E family sporulation regulatory protein-aspartic acid phosphatase [Fredinandcohnia sp. 179-A 10B2 NHS]|uniref:Spo0E family sporulation regulatory protein-aspartic acid phosphatase n=1 Tax=Fredinandcohnia sp. 179-A 10B2 NHS TaxID=3235176 RepID=UPI0039A293AC